jgi:hypothetical protein
MIIEFVGTIYVFCKEVDFDETYGHYFIRIRITVCSWIHLFGLFGNKLLLLSVSGICRVLVVAGLELSPICNSEH